MPGTERNPTYPPIQTATSTLTRADHWDHLLARCGVKRSDHHVPPGLYALGDPTADSPVFVTANYTLSFDALRAGLAGVDGYILVLDTQGINVWCAAGKGSFGTDELVGRIQATGLGQVVRHRLLILPQLGAPGVAAHEVTRRTRFKVEYGPVRASDLLRYFKTGRATPEMRRVRFGLLDRMILVPVELRLPLLLALAATLLYTLGVKSPTWGDAGWLGAILAGVVLFPLLLPWLPTRDFSSKGFVLGGLVALPFVVPIIMGHPGTPEWGQLISALAFVLMWSAVTAYLALSFTGSTTFTSRTGVRREIFTYIPIMAWMFGIGLALHIVLYLIPMLGGLS